MASPFSSLEVAQCDNGVGVTIQLPQSIREGLMKSRLELQEQQQKQQKTTAVLHSLSNTSVRTSLAAIKLATLAVSSSSTEEEQSVQQSEEEEEENENEENDEYKIQYERELDQDIILAPFQNQIIISEEDDERSSSSILDDDDDDDALSLTTPSCLPLLVISLEQLCGYIPLTMQDYLQQKHQVEEALYGIACASSATQQDSSTTSNKEDNLLSSIHFSNHAAELFELGIATHSDTTIHCPSCSSSTADLPQPTIALPYPEYILVNNNVNNNNNKNNHHHHLQKVSTMWKRILQSHRIPVVEHLFTYVRKCNRDIQWKYHMIMYISEEIVKKELHHQQKKDKLRLVQEFKQKRSYELEKLYETREVFERQLEDATDKLYTLRQHKQAKSEKVLLVDLASETFDFLLQQQPSSTLASKHDDDDNNDESNDDDDDDDGIKHESSKDDVGLYQPKKSHHSNTGQMTSTDEIYAETSVRTWERRLAKIDELLESMQDDQWAEEEQVVKHIDLFIDDEGEDTINDNNQLSLLDQILAMIMGKITAPQYDTNTNEEHFQNIIKEHQTIIKEWKVYFGRLPPPVLLVGEAATQPNATNKDVSTNNDVESSSMYDDTNVDGTTTTTTTTTTAMMNNIIILLDVVDDWEDLVVAGNEDATVNESAVTTTTTDVGLTRNSNLKQQKGLRPGGRT